MTKASFINAFYKTCAHEGGYVHDPLDRGGETYRGIARKYWPKWGGWRIIDIYKQRDPEADAKQLSAALNKNEGLRGFVEDFYRHNFWNENACYLFDQEVAEELFDTGVNQGAAQAAKYFQKALNKLNRNQKDYPDLIVDGEIGSATSRAYDALMATAAWKSRSYLIIQGWLLSMMNFYQLEKYMNITDKDLSQERFVPGWLNRV